jgi:hypothetical protein
LEKECEKENPGLERSIIYDNVGLSVSEAAVAGAIIFDGWYLLPTAGPVLAPAAL